MVTENKELTEEIKAKELWELSNPSERILFKSKYLLISNLTKRMTETQNILLSLCLLHAKLDGRTAKAEFDISEVIELTQNSKYKKYDSPTLTKDRTVVSSAFINLVADDTVNGLQLEGETIQIFSKIRYSRGKYTAYFNTSLDDSDESDIVKLLKSKEKNPIIYNLDKFAKLKTYGQILYEHLLLASSYSQREMVLSVEELAKIFNITSEYSSQFKVIRYKYLSPAINDINEQTNLDVKISYIKSGKSVTHVTFVWLVERVELPPTEKQVVYMKELYVKLSKLNLATEEDLELLKKLKKGHLVTRNEAIAIIGKAASLKKNLGIQKKNRESAPGIVGNQYPEIFDKIPDILPKMYNNIVIVLEEFPEEERIRLFDYAHELFFQNNAQSVNYIATTLSEWASAGVKNLTDASVVHDKNYGRSYGPEPGYIEPNQDFLDAINLWS